MSADCINNIDWLSVEKSFYSRVQISNRKTMWKLWCTKSHTFRYNKSISDFCPVCTNQTEDFTHVLTYPSAENIQKPHLLSLKQTIKKIGTSDIMTEYIMTNVRNWIASREP